MTLYYEYIKIVSKVTLTLKQVKMSLKAFKTRLFVGFNLYLQTLFHKS